MKYKFRSELIGAHIEVIEGKNKNNKNMKGTIINETKETIILETKTGEKQLFKKDISFKLGNSIINGKEIIGRPEERLKA